MKFLICFVGCSLIAMTVGCGPAETSNSNGAANRAGANRIQNVNASELPPGLSASPIAPVANVNAVNSAPRGATPTPGIPDPKTLGKPMKPGATPTPGIPDPETLKKQMEQMRKAMNSNANRPPQPPPPGAGDGSMMKKKRSIANANN